MRMNPRSLQVRFRRALHAAMEDAARTTRDRERLALPPLHRALLRHIEGERLVLPEEVRAVQAFVQRRDVLNAAEWQSLFGGFPPRYIVAKLARRVNVPEHDDALAWGWSTTESPPDGSAPFTLTLQYLQSIVIIFSNLRICILVSVVATPISTSEAPFPRKAPLDHTFEHHPTPCVRDTAHAASWNRK